MSGDGIAFAITTDADPPLNSSGRFLGLMQEHPEERTQRIVFLEFDSFQNGEVGFNDPSASHIGINKGNMSSVMLRDTSDPSDPLYLYANYTITAWLSYNSSENVIRVWATNNSASSERPANPILVLQKINLTQYFENHNHTDVYAVITAASGNNSQNTILRNWNLTIEIQSERTRDLDLRRLYLLLLLLPVLFVALAAYRMRGAKQRKLIGKRIAVLEVASKPVHRYKYFELKRATQSFRSDFIIGRGGFSIVYKGLLPDGNLVAIKRMRDGFADADLIAKEVQIISKIEHRNLLRLEGWCFEAGETLLVFKYMPNGSLDSYLHGEKRKSGYVLRSKTRIQIIRDVAAALEYLHHCLEECVLHRDVKAANVLLTEDMEAKLGDFGLARLGPHNEIFTTLPMGTPGYVAPEVHTGQVTEKTDVYSFGVLVIEIACGERPLDPYSSTYSRLVDRVWLYHSKGSIMGVLDPSLMQEMTTQSDAATDTKGVDEELKKWKCVLHLGLTCCQASPSARPDMRKVLKALEDFEIMEAPRSWTLYPGENFSSAGRMSSDASSSTISQYFSVLSYKEDRS
ncbi:hypothetical protein KP509_02G067500 [Ceratopteris richardii]|nr:hypothetical protein KP509_02G067500 [Ceratopteris richardii]